MQEFQSQQQCLVSIRKCLAGSLRCLCIQFGTSFCLGRVGALNHLVGVGFLLDLRSSVEFIQPSDNIWDTGVQNKWILGPHIFEMNPISLSFLCCIFFPGFSANLDALGNNWSEISLHDVYIYHEHALYMDHIRGKDPEIPLKRHRSIPPIFQSVLA